MTLLTGVANNEVARVIGVAKDLGDIALARQVDRGVMGRDGLDRQGVRQLRVLGQP